MGLAKFRKRNAGVASKKQGEKSRKETRKELRKERKAKKNEFFMKRKESTKKHFKGSAPGRFVRPIPMQEDSVDFPKKKLVPSNGKKKGDEIKIVTLAKEMEHERKQVMKLKQEMLKQRQQQLIEANKEEDRNIKKLERQLKLDKRKGKSVPKSFVASGLDYILDVCDSEKIKAAANTEKNIYEDSGSEFEDDLAIATGKRKSADNSKDVKKRKKVNSESEDLDSAAEDSSEDILDDDNFEDSASDINCEISSKGKQDTGPSKTQRAAFDDEDISEDEFLEGSETDDQETQCEGYILKKGANKTKKVHFINTTDNAFPEDSGSDNRSHGGTTVNLQVLKKGRKVKAKKAKGSTRMEDQLEGVEAAEDKFLEDGEGGKRIISSQPSKKIRKGQKAKVVSFAENLSDDDDDDDDDKHFESAGGLPSSISKKGVQNSQDMTKSSVEKKTIKGTVSLSRASDSSESDEEDYLSQDSGAEESFGDLSRAKAKGKKIDSEQDVDCRTSESCMSSEEGDDKDEQRGGENSDGFWEDIYGRKRDKCGNVVQENSQKYVPPNMRQILPGESSKKREELLRLRKQMKGLLNRLAESNMHSIANQMEELYMRNSRNDMNETLTELYLESLVSATLTPERLVMEHTMLIAILHANVGTEIGAHVLQNLVKKFDQLCSIDLPVENKELDNIMLVIVHLYTFKVFSCNLIYDIMSRLCDKFREKEIEVIILVLRSVGFNLRKDDPIALKDFIMRVQKLAGEAPSLKDSSRLGFMLDVLMTIKNNNMAKLPQYDPTLSVHLKKLMKTMLHTGNYVTELKISLEDLLKADERGRWWVVGSAWTGSTPAPPSSCGTGGGLPSSVGEVTRDILELARRQRMNTANRRNIFCILMTAEDYLDAFEKLLKLGLKGQPEQEIVYVLVDCLLQENTFNPYYAHIAGQLCISDRRHQMTIQCCVWDKFKELSQLTDGQITNLAKFLAHLFLEKSMPISILKVMQFADMDKRGVRLVRQVLLSILMSDRPDEEVAAVFGRIACANKLADFREALRLFLHHFVGKNLKKKDPTTSEGDVAKLTERIVLADQTLVANSKLL